MKESTDLQIEQTVKAYYAALNLEAERVDALVSEAMSQPRGNKLIDKASRSSRRRFLIAASIGSLLVAGVLGRTAYERHDVQRRQRRSDDLRLVTELVVNHRNRSVLDIESSSLAAIADQLNDVNFDLALPGDMLSHYNIVGGRYCSLLDETAIQLRLIDAQTTGEATAFVTAADRKFSPFDGVATRAEGLSISASHYRDLFVTLVKED